MGRYRGVLLGVVSALLLTLAVVVVILIFAWQAFQSESQDRMKSLTRLLALRAEVTVAVAADSLRDVVGQPLEPCSPEERYRLRSIIVQNRVADDVVFLGAGAQSCSRWETEILQRLQRSESLRLPGFTAVILLPERPDKESGALMLTEGAYGVLINLSRFLDVTVEPGTKLGLATTDGSLLVANPPNSFAMMERLVQHGEQSVPEGEQAVVRRQDGWVAVVAMPKASLAAFWAAEAATLLPPLLLTAVLVFALALALSLKHLSPIAEMRLALLRREFTVYYQPVMEMASGRCIGAEALLRWQRSDGSWVRPDIFIPQAEDNGLIRSLTNQLIDMVANDMGDLLRQNRHLHVALNLCVDDVVTGRVLPVLNRAIKSADILPEQIWLEVTERSVLDINAAQFTLRRARAIGYAVAMDDFGTGYSNLQNLQDLQVDILKIDKTFIDGLDKPNAAGTVVSHIIEMAHSLRLTVVAEGVETQAQAQSLMERHVSLAQGWLYAPAMPRAEFVTFCQNHSRATKRCMPKA